MQIQHMLSRTITSGDASLFIRVIGGYDDVPTLIVLHGGPGISHDYMLGLASLANSQLRVVFYDQRQVGLSTGVAASSEPMQEWADDLDAVRKAVGSESVHLLGHSAGGFAAIAYGSIYPQRTQSIIFVDSVSPIASEQGRAMERMSARAGKFQAEGLIPDFIPPTPEDGTAMLASIVPVIHFVKPHRPDALGNATYRPIVGDRIMGALGNYDLRPAVSRLTMPTLSYVSSVPFGVEMAGSLYDALPRKKARRFMIPDCGHLPWIECPEPFFKEIKYFLAPFLAGKNEFQP
jgi:proline iminopeptidase